MFRWSFAVLVRRGQGVGENLSSAKNSGADHVCPGFTIGLIDLILVPETKGCRDRQPQPGSPRMRMPNTRQPPIARSHCCPGSSSRGLRLAAFFGDLSPVRLLLSIGLFFLIRGSKPLTSDNAPRFYCLVVWQRPARSRRLDPFSQVCATTSLAGSTRCTRRFSAIAPYRVHSRQLGLRSVTRLIEIVLPIIQTGVRQPHQNGKPDWTGGNPGLNPGKGGGGTKRSASFAKPLGWTANDSVSNPGHRASRFCPSATETSDPLTAINVAKEELRQIQIIGRGS